MKTVGIIAEYNPFHNGHQYQIEEAKRRTGASHAIIIMSGDFVQRGTPAIIDKHIRTMMALNGGADVIFELPVIYATASAELFALGAVTLFEELSCIDYLCFGSECGEVSILSEIANIFIEEPEFYKKNLKYKLQQGCSFPHARHEALLDYLREKDSRHNLDYINHILSKPNNILGIEYIKALIKIKSDIKPLTISRKGRQYHDIDISDTQFSSATGTRSFLEHAYQQNQTSLTAYMKNLSSSMLESNIQILHRETGLSTPVSADDLSIIIRYLIRSLDKKHALEISDFSEDLFNKLKKHSDIPFSYTELALYLKSKHYTLSRIQRILIHLFLGITIQDIDMALKQTAHYVRLLGFNRHASAILRYVQDQSSINIITKPADAKNMLPANLYRTFELDIHAARLYSDIIANKFSVERKDEYQKPVIII